jgi:amidase
MRGDPPTGPFCAYGAPDLSTRTEGPLAGLSFGVKDLFDVEGLPTGAGSPDWLATHPVATRTAPAVATLLDAGARLVGKTMTDEMAWSLNGQNAHYGTPANPAAPDRIPGGSSSGSASATAAGLVDFAVGSDTGGSVRLPASYCGIYGMRPTHGRIAIDGAVPLAPSYDTVGWFARDPQMLARVGAVLLGEPPSSAPPAPPRLLIAEDLFELAGPAVAEALAAALATVRSIAGEVQSIVLADGRLTDWRNAFRIIQSAEAWASHGAWITQYRPSFGPGVCDRFAAAAHVDPGELAAARELRARIRERIDAILHAGTIVVAPTAPGPAPLRTAADADLEAFRAKALALLCTAGHCGLPQISLPLGGIDGAPIGLSLIGARGEDLALLGVACRLDVADPDAEAGHA